MTSLRNVKFNFLRLKKNYKLIKLYSRTNVLIQSDKRPYTVGQTSLYSRTNVLIQIYKLYFTSNPVSFTLFVVLKFSNPSLI